MAKQVDKYVNPLLVALDFLSCAQRAKGSDAQRHCMLSMNSAVAFDGVTAAGIRISENFHCCPDTARLTAALENCTTGYTMTQVAHDRLLIQSGDFQAHVPLCDPQTLQWPQPDPKMLLADDKIKAALKAVVGVVNDKAVLLYEASILLQARTVVASNGSVVLEAFHGWDLPPDVLLPKSIVPALMGVRKPIVAMGYGPTTVTFWYEDDSWIRTQRYVESYPDATKLLSTTIRPEPFPIGLFTAVKQLAPFSEDGQVYCKDGRASSHSFNVSDAYTARLMLDVSGINASRVYKIESIAIIEKYAKFYDDQTVRDRTFFYGTADIKLGTRKAEVVPVQVRGVMIHRSEDAAPVDPNAPVYASGVPAPPQFAGDDDIPF